MASIKGVTIKSVKTAMGMEGPFTQGNIYIDGKKAGFWSQDGHGGPDCFDFDESELTKRAKAYLKEHPDVDSMQLLNKSVDEVDFNNLPLYTKDFIEPESIFLAKILDLSEIEKVYKKWNKDGHYVVGYLSYIHGGWPIPKNDGSIFGRTNRKDLMAEYENIHSQYPYATFKVYESPEDFVID